MTAIGRSLAATAPLVLLLAVAGCGSKSNSSTAAVGTALTASCTDIAAALSDGPDPDADPVGYAQAQVLPLKQIATSNTTLAADITALANAYQAVAATDNSKAANTQVTTASAAVDKICPGATS